MLAVLLCGAADTSDLAHEFADLVREFGGEPWFYQSGNIFYSNTAHADWNQNSSLSVQQADMCVFVLVREIGRTTWDVELRTALSHGKPFLLLCLDDTYHRYLELSRSGVDRAALPADDLELVDLLHYLGAKLNLTAVPFTRPYFPDVLRGQMSNLVADALHLMQQRNRRDSILHTLRPGQAPNEFEQSVLTEIALDETEFVRTRKHAVLALLGVGVAEDTARELVGSASQGIARLAIEHLDELIAPGTNTADLLDHCIAVANDSDDIGLSRRLIGKILDVSLQEGLSALQRLDLAEIGSRRRLAAVLEAREDDIHTAGLEILAASLLDRCLTKTADAGWIARCRALLDRLRHEGDQGAPTDGTEPR